MRRVAEIIYVVESEREKFLQDSVNLDDEAKQALWRKKAAVFLTK